MTTPFRTTHDSRHWVFHWFSTRTAPNIGCFRLTHKTQPGRVGVAGDGQALFRRSHGTKQPAAVIFCNILRRDARLLAACGLLTRGANIATVGPRVDDLEGRIGENA